MNNTRRRLPLLGVVLAIFAASANAAAYKCKNAEGQTTFSDKPCGAEAQKMVIVGAGKGIPAQPDINLINACVAHLKSKKSYADPGSVQAEVRNIRWVAVKDVGALELLEVSVSSKNEEGVYAGAGIERCLVNPGRASIFKGSYELLP